MKIIDLTWEIYSWMRVYPWDPEVEIGQLCTIDNDEWNMKRIHINSHDGTHVNVPIHWVKWWKTLDNYSLENFIWHARVYNSYDDINSKEWLVFNDIDITMEIAEKIVKANTPFVALPSKFEFDLEIERYLLENWIISYERLENTDKLPDKFMFYWVPLKIREWDWSPVRAYAIV